METAMNYLPHQGTRSIQPKFQPVRPGKEDHLKRWTRFSKLFRLDRTDPLSFGPKYPESLVEWIAPKKSNFSSSTRRKALRENNYPVSGALLNRKHALFHIRYFENGPLEPG